MTKAPGVFVTLRSRPNVQLPDLTSEEQKREPIRHARVRLELPSEVPLPRGGRDGELIGEAPARAGSGVELDTLSRLQPLTTRQLRRRDR
jgi:hypothetical protein